jgi:hypothetical protein
VPSQEPGKVEEGVARLRPARQRPPPEPKLQQGAHLAADAGPTSRPVQENVNIDDQGELDGQSSQTVGQAALTATVTSMGVGTITLSVNGQSLTLPLPAGLTLATNIVGSSVTLTLNLGGGSATAETDDQQGDNNDNQDDDQNDGGGSDD